MSFDIDILRFAADFSIDGQHIRMKRMHWGSDFPQPFYAYQATISYNSSEIVGYGSAFNEEGALRKSVAELFERCFFKLEKSKTSSSGFAVHHSLEKASLHAALELIERDLFMCFYLTRTPIYDFTEDAGQAFPEFRDVRTVLLDRGSDLRIGLMHKSDNLYAVLCICFNPIGDSGCIIGASCKLSLREAIMAALSEVLVNYLAVQDNEYSPMDRKEFESERKIDLQNHFRLGLHPETGELMRALLKHDGISKSDSSTYFESMSIQELEKKKSFSDVPLVFCKASNIDLQILTFGMLNQADVNLKRLSSFAGKELKFEDLETYPHPFY